jgi:hypothetical protein
VPRSRTRPRVDELPAEVRTVTGAAGRDLRAALATELTSAMRRRDRTTLRVLRSAAAAIANAEAVPLDEAPAAGALESAPRGAGATDVARRELDEAAVRAVVTAEITELEAAARRFEELGDPARASLLHRDADVLGALLDE